MDVTEEMDVVDPFKFINSLPGSKATGIYNTINLSDPLHTHGDFNPEKLDSSQKLNMLQPVSCEVKHIKEGCDLSVKQKGALCSGSEDSSLFLTYSKNNSKRLKAIDYEQTRSKTNNTKNKKIKNSYNQQTLCKSNAKASEYVMKVVIKVPVDYVCQTEDLKCCICSEIVSEFDEHMVCHAMAYMCGMCGIFCKTQRDLTKHIKTKCLLASKLRKKQKNIVKQYTCEKCDRCFSKASQLKVHFKTHTHKSQITSNVNITKLLSIENQAKPEVNIYKCQHCEMQFTDLNNLEIHLKNYTNCKNNYNQIYESISFLDNNSPVLDDNHQIETEDGHISNSVKEIKLESNLNSIYNEVLGPSTPLILCEVKETSLANLENVNSNLYSSLNSDNDEEIEEDTENDALENMHKCSKCENAFLTSDGLRDHLRTHINNTIEPDKQQYKCKKCEKCFAKVGQLKLHKRVHTTNRNFVCEVCNKIFTHNSMLKVHKRTHTGEKPFVCSTCGKGFCQSSNFKKHIRSHTSERPFKCLTEGCEKSFKRKESLAYHMETKCNPDLVKQKLSKDTRREIEFFKCNKCLKYLPTIYNLEVHLKEHATQSSKEKEKDSQRVKGASNHVLSTEINSNDAEISTDIDSTYTQVKEQEVETGIVCVNNSTQHQIIEIYNEGNVIHDQTEASNDAGDHNTSFLLDTINELERCAFKLNSASGKQIYHHGAACTDNLQSKNKEIDCDIGEDLLEAINQKEKQMGNNLMFVCGMCDYSCIEYSDLKSHMQQSHINKPFHCDHCGKGFKFKSLLKEHVKIHVGVKPFECHDCGKRFYQRHGLQSHMKSHTDLRPYSCDHCEKKFNERWILIKHIKTHTGEQLYTCKECKKTFIEQKNLEKHMRYHTGELPHVCQVCGDGFLQSSSLTSHMFKHSDEKPFRCEQCGLSFKREFHLRDHMSVHTGVRPHKCTECAKCFRQKSSLRTHMKTHMQVEKLFLCNECGRAFGTQGALKAHAFTHTGVKPYSCTICEKSFNRLANLQQHLRIHTGEKPYTCEECGSSFNHVGTFKKHKLLHTNEKPYTCETCGKEFRSLGNLTKHQRIHSGLKPYECTDCGKRFRQNHHLTAHKSTHNAEPAALFNNPASSAIAPIGPTVTTEQSENGVAASILGPLLPAGMHLMMVEEGTVLDTQRYMLNL